MKSQLNPVQIIGGGFSGLTLAYYLCKKGLAVELFEKSHRLGGVISSEIVNGGLIESAANGLLGDARVAALFRELQVMPADKADARSARYIFRNKPTRWPLLLGETAQFVLGALKYFLFKNLLIKNNESLKSFCDRVFGEAAFKYLVGPALQGVYGTTDLSAQLIHKIFRAQKNKQHLKFNARPVAWLSAEDKKYFTGTVAPQRGMQELIDKLAQYVTRRGGTIHLETMGEVHEGRFTAIATSATAAALLLANKNPDLAGELAKIEYLPLTSATVELGANAPRLNGFGCLFPKDEDFFSLGVLFNNSIFKNRSPQHTETWILPVADANEAQIKMQIQQDRHKMLGHNDEINLIKVYPWPKAIPKYNEQIFLTIDRFHKLQGQLKHIYLTGNYLGRIGLAKILEHNEELAEQIYSEMC